MYNPFHPPPAAPAFGQNKVLPEAQASLLSRLVFQWLGPFLNVGYSRPLEKEDFWELPTSRLTSTLTAEVEKNFYARCPPEKRPKSSTAAASFTEEKADTKMTKDKEKHDDTWKHTPAVRDSKRSWFPQRPEKFKTGPDGQKYDSSLLKALHKTFFRRWWTAGLLKLIADTLKTTTPLINKVILTWLTQVYIYHKLSDVEKAAGAVQKPQGIGYGIGLAFALFSMQEVSSLMTNHYMMISMTMGLSIRTALIGAIFRKSLRLSGRAKLDHGVGQITTMISTDTARLDRSSAYAHNIWVGPIQICIGIGLLINNLGYSALVGVGVLVFGFPLQFIFVKIIFAQRKKGVVITDRRIRIITEVLQGIRLIKFYAWEAFYIQQISNLRTREIQAIKKSAIARSGLIAMVTAIPLLASILSFITYALTGHDLNVAIIFSSLQYFNIIRMPLTMFPIVIAALADGAVALNRISEFLKAEELAEPYVVDNEQNTAVNVDGTFTWENSVKPTNSGRAAQAKNEAKKNARDAKHGRTKKTAEPVLPTMMVDMKSDDLMDTEIFDEKPFELTNLKLNIPRGSFVAIVGRVGSGKSSLLQALIGEMRKIKGNVIFGGSVAYVPQTPWIRNATLRENILFGQENDEEKFWEIIRACELEHDLQILPYREETEIGEKGINLSGGQKARVSLARAAYSPSDIVLLDDPLSAVDAYVGKAILENCILNGPFANRTRILVTHALHVLDKADYIYVMKDGIIAEEGTYNHLMKDSIVFSHLMDEYGNLEHEKQTAGSKEIEGHALARQNKLGDKGVSAALMQTEERNTGAVTWEIYSKYLGFAGGLLWVPAIIMLLVFVQATQVGNNLFLGFWTAGSISGFHQGDYMGVYAALGIASAIFSFMLSLAFALASLAASLRMFKAALVGVLRSPASFYDTTPIGRIISRLSKDQDTLDTELSMTLYQFLATFSSILGTAALVFYIFPYLGIIFVPLSVIYWFIASYYRRTSVETKRMDSLMRSALYGSYSETLTGLSTIRAYRDQDRSVRNADHGLDFENRCYFMTIAIQRWLGLRLDLIGNVLILGIALFAAAFRNTVDPSKIGVVLSYTLSITQVLSEMVSQFAQNEQNMNAAERVLVYTALPPEGDTHTPNDPPACWPENGEIKFIGVELAYRDLPLVLKGINFEVKPGEKVGIVGRTGSGKSSLMQALFRFVELRSGSIEIDGRNIRDMGLDALRRQIALVPQDSTLFLGSLRENLDPQGTRTDAELISALQRAWLLPTDGSADVTIQAKFSLDSTVGDEGSNFSAGEKQLLALCRALVKNSRIIVLDEATSNVDVETDAKLQKTIQTEFTSSTLLCIAHRLNTVVYYDRILVMDDGRIAEFDTVLNLFDKEDSIFRSLCNEAALSRQDILRIREESCNGSTSMTSL